MIKKSKIALGVATATLTITGAMVSPAALAQTQAEKTSALETQVNEMATMMQAMQAELSRVKATSEASDSAKVQELDQWMASVKNAPVYTAAKDSQFIVRGGWMHFDHSRGSVTDALGAGTGVGTDILTSPVDNDAFYYGGAFNYNINNDLFGLMDGVSFQIEFGIEYSEVGEREESGLTRAITALDVVNGGTALGGLGLPATPGTNLQQSVTVNMLRVNASPKIKFNHGSKFRPWIIPLGLDLNIISPPSDAVTVLNTGMNFGAGADYELFRGISIGVDGRYHWTPDDLDGIDTDGYQFGGYVGFQF